MIFHNLWQLIQREEILWKIVYRNGRIIWSILKEIVQRRYIIIQQMGKKSRSRSRSRDRDREREKKHREHRKHSRERRSRSKEVGK